MSQECVCMYVYMFVCEHVCLNKKVYSCMHTCVYARMHHHRHRQVEVIVAMWVTTPLRIFIVVIKTVIAPRAITHVDNYVCRRAEACCKRSKRARVSAPCSNQAHATLWRHANNHMLNTCPNARSETLSTTTLSADRQGACV